MFYDNLKNACDLNGLKISPIVKECGGAIGSIDGWKKGATPNSEIVKQLSLRLNVSTDFLLFGKEKSPSTVLADDEQELLTYYKQLDSNYKGKVIGKAEALAEVTAEKKAASNPVKISIQREKIYIELYDLPVSAGNGICLDGCDKNMLEVYSTPLTNEANFALEIRGDSMEPKFHDGDYVLIRTQPCVDIGEIGIFILNDEGYIKKFGGDKLISLNSNYDDVLIHDYDDFCCKGRVLGVLPEDCIVE